MKKGKVFFHPIEGTGSLTISWTKAPKGDATEADQGSGVGFFSEEESLLAVIFDEVKAKQDRQILEFDQLSIEVTVKAGKVDYIITSKSNNSISIKSRAKKRTLISK